MSASPLISLILAPLCAAYSCVDTTCKVSDQTSLMQVKQTLEIGMKRNDEAHAEFGRFLHIKHDGEDDTCHLEGIWDDGKSSPVKFHSHPSQLMISIPHLPTLALGIHPTTPELSTFELDGVSATTQADIEASQFLMNGSAAIVRSPFAQDGGYHLSSLLSAKGLHGAKSRCTSRIHMFLLSLEKMAKRAKRIDAEAQKAMHQKAKWAQYGFDAQCPVISPWSVGGKAITPWECKKVPKAGATIVATGRLEDDQWYQPPDKKLKDNWRHGLQKFMCQPAHFKSEEELEKSVLEDWGDQEDAHMMSSAWKECVGLCGGGCRCWGNMCPNYYCDYNPVCCAHDWACSDWNGQGTSFNMFSKACAQFALVEAACQAGTPAVESHPEDWGMGTDAFMHGPKKS